MGAQGKEPSILANSLELKISPGVYRCHIGLVEHGLNERKKTPLTRKSGQSKRATNGTNNKLRKKALLITSFGRRPSM